MMVRYLFTKFGINTLAAFRENRLCGRVDDARKGGGRTSA